MAKNVPLPNLADALEQRILTRMRRYEPRSPELKAALMRIGFLIEAEAKLNIRRKGIIDTGALLNSIRFEFFANNDKAGIRVGSFGNPYAAINEFGGPFTDRQRRAMFAALRDRGKLKRGFVGKGIIQGNRWKERPYLRPAVRSNEKRIIKILGDLAR